MDSVTVTVNLQALNLTTFQAYPEVRLSWEQWLNASGRPWRELAEWCFRVAGGRDSQHLNRVFGAWAILFFASGRLDDYADGDKVASVWDKLGPTVGSSVALALIAEAIGLALDPSIPATCQAASVLTRCLKDAALGQAWDNMGVDTLSAYEQMLSLKAAPLVAALTESMTMLAEANGGLTQALAECGREIGLAVQIANDYSGIWGAETVGRRVGGDLAQPQLTYPLFYALEVQHPYRNEFQQLLADEPVKRNTGEMLKILNAIGARHFMLAAIQLRWTRIAQSLTGWVSKDDLAQLEQWYTRYLLGDRVIMAV